MRVFEQTAKNAINMMVEEGLIIKYYENGEEMLKLTDKGRQYVEDNKQADSAVKTLIESLNRSL